MEKPTSLSLLFKTRDYRRSDYQAVRRLWKETGLAYPVRGDNVRTIQDTLSTGGKLLLLEESNTGIVCGTSWMTCDGRRIHLHHFGILPGFQGKGLSKLLLEASLKFVKKKNLQVKIEVHQDNFKAISLYSRYGFKKLGDYDVYIIRNINEI